MAIKTLKCALFAIFASIILTSHCETSSGGETPYDQWKNGPGKDPNFFPIAVWLQDPRNAERYKAAGINLYVGLWKGPTTNQLEALAKAGMRVICSQNKTALANQDNPTIVAWMHGD